MSTKSKQNSKRGKTKKAIKSSYPNQGKITVNTEESKKSLHIINLKNPHQELFKEDFIPPKPLIIPQPTPHLNTPIKLPKTLPKKVRKIGVNFIASKTSTKNSFNYQKPNEEREKILSLTKTRKKRKNSEVEETEGIEDIFAKPPYFKFTNLYIPCDWYKKIAIFILIAIILVLPLQAFTYYQNLQDTKDRILLITNEAIENLKLAQQSATEFDLTTASSQFNEAKNNFTSAQQEINALNILAGEILKLLPGQDKSVAAGLVLLEAGETVAEIGQILIDTSQNFLTNKNLTDYYQSLVTFKSNLRGALEKFNQIKIKIEEIKMADLPAEHRQAFEKVLTFLPTIQKGFIEIYDIDEALLKVLGHNQWQRYLLIFLNNNELRGGGGFMGSFGLFDIDQGKIKNLEIPGGGTYAIQGQLIPKVISPEPLHLINSRWEFQDANWWPDFPTTAKKIQWFYQSAGGPSVDGIIVITSTLMERLLAIFEPISMPDYGREITSENFVSETQKIVELEYDKEENKPKQFIADLAPKLIERIFSANAEELTQLLNVLKESLNERQLLVYFNDEKIEKIVSEFGWSGELRQTEGDYLSVVHSNIAGGKTDGVIKEIIQHQAEVQPDGSIIDTIKLIRHHTGIPGENIFTGVQNNSYVRFYVPLGSALLEISGFKKPPENLFEEPLVDYQPDVDLISVESEKIKDERTGTDIYKESGKTVFGNWLQLKAGEIQEAMIKYRLPFKFTSEGQNTFYYSLLTQKQAGSLGSELQSNLKLNDQLKFLAKFPANLPGDEKETSFKAKLNVDQFYGVVLVNK